MYDLRIQWLDPFDGTMQETKFYSVTMSQVFSLLDINEYYSGRGNVKARISLA